MWTYNRHVRNWLKILNHLWKNDRKPQGGERLTHTVYTFNDFRVHKEIRIYVSQTWETSLPKSNSCISAVTYKWCTTIIQSATLQNLRSTGRRIKTKKWFCVHFIARTFFTLQLPNFMYVGECKMNKYHIHIMNLIFKPLKNNTYLNA